MHSVTAAVLVDTPKRMTPSAAAMIKMADRSAFRLLRASITAINRPIGINHGGTTG